MRKPLSVILYAVFFLAGLSLLLYPSASDRWNVLRQSQAIAGYIEQVASLNRDVHKLWSDAEAYNRFLWEPGNSFVGSEEQAAEYQQLLNVTEVGMMGYIEIPDIRCTLPIYHGTEESIFRPLLGMWNGPAFRWVERAPTAFSWATGDFQAPGCLPTWISLTWGTFFGSGCWMRC